MRPTGFREGIMLVLLFPSGYRAPPTCSDETHTREGPNLDQTWARLDAPWTRPGPDWDLTWTRPPCRERAHCMISIYPTAVSVPQTEPPRGAGWGPEQPKRKGIELEHPHGVKKDNFP